MEWNEPLYHVGTGEQGRTGVLVSHGYSGSPRAVQEWALSLADAGYTVALPLLDGHGLTPEAMESSRWTDWTEDVEGAYTWLRERTDEVFTSGLSMGGALALWLAERHPEIAGVITVNASVRDPRELLIRFLGRMGLPPWVKAIGNDIMMPGVDEKAYDRVPTRSALQLVRLQSIVRKNLHLVCCPALLFSSVTDHLVPPANQQEIFEGISSKSKALVKLKNSHHVATMDGDRELIFAKTIEFVAAHSSRGRRA